VARQVVEAFRAAWDAHDGAALAALMAEDGIYEVVPQGRAFGAELIEQQMTFMQSLSSDFSIRYVSVVEEGGRLATEWEMEGTNDGPFEPFRLTPSGRRFTIRGAWFFTIEDDRVRSCRAYWDLAGLLNQIGVRPPGQVAWHLAAWAEESTDDG
jgi:steroid delta-isomerase-like uncharacterized protein